MRALSVPYGTMSGMRGSELPEPTEPPELPELPDYAERVLDAAERIPPGRVLTYGDIAEWLRDEDEDEDGDRNEDRDGDRARNGDGPRNKPGTGTGTGRANGRGSGGPRQVGRVLALYGATVPWWRIVRADGVLLPGHELEAMDRYRAEGTPLRDAARTSEGHLPRLDIRRARWDGAED